MFILIDTSFYQEPRLLLATMITLCDFSNILGHSNLYYKALQILWVAEINDQSNLLTERYIILNPGADKLIFSTLSRGQVPMTNLLAPPVISLALPQLFNSKT